MRSRLRRVAGPLVALAALGAFWLVAPGVEKNRLQEYLRAAEAAVLTCAFAVFVTALVRAFDSHVKTGAQRFFMGLILLFAGMDGGSLWRLMWRMGGGATDLELAWMLTNTFTGFMLWMQIVGVFLMVSGPAVPVYDDKGVLEDEHVPWRRLLTTGAVCVTVMWLVVVVRPGASRINDVIEAIEPYVRPIVWWGRPLAPSPAGPWISPP
jgi:hypothetical protein